MTTTDQMTREEAAPVGRRAALQVSGLKLMAAGMLVLQLAWVLAVPPFRGSDEFDHAYKAAAVARGEWVPSPSSATRGTGAWVHVPYDLVAAAQPECKALPYTHDEDCVGTRQGDVVRIASGAGRYNPVFYALVGLPALPFSGDAALYVMRLATVLLGWLLFCGALAATRVWARSSWPYLALAVASAPVLVYSGSIVAPNGVEMMAAMAFWASLIGVVRGPSESHSWDRRLLALGVISGAALVTTRSLGPVWCLLVVLTVVVAFRPSARRWQELARARSTWIATGAMLVATLLSVWWIVSMGSLKLATPGKPLPPVSLGARINHVLHDVPVTMLQSIAAFPFRNQPTQPVVYACFLVLFIGWIVLAMLAPSGWWSRLAVVGTCLIAVAAPALIQIVTYDTFRSQWQGRYALPYSIGMALVAGAVLERWGRPWVRPQLVLVGLLLFTVAQVVGPVDVLRHESTHSPLAGTSAWLQPSPVLVAVIAVIGAVLLWFGASRARPVDAAEES